MNKKPLRGAAITSKEIDEMTNKNKTVTLVLCVLLGYLGIHRFYLGKTKSGVVYLLTAGLCGIGWIVDIILICTDKFSGITTTQRTYMPQSTQIQAVPIPQNFQAQTTPVVSTYVPMPFFPPISNGNGLKYEYENDLCMINITAAELGAELGGEITFKQEPENAYDENAVAIWQNGRKLGYIYRGQSQEMANRWINNNYPLLGFISYIDISQNKIKYKIGFYSLLEKMRKEKFNLTGIRQKSEFGELRQDNLEYCNVGNSVSIEIDDDEEKYIVSSSDGEIGTLPQKAKDFLGSKKRAVGILTKIECDDDGKYTAEVEIYV